MSTDKIAYYSTASTMLEDSTGEYVQVADYRATVRERDHLHDVLKEYFEATVAYERLKLTSVGQTVEDAASRQSAAEMDVRLVLQPKTEPKTEPTTVPEANDIRLKPDYVGPCEMNCPQKCEVPAGMELIIMPRPRHNWPGMVHCPNEGCSLSFIFQKAGAVMQTEAET